jgi:bifunctional UDP-N-acetylglucosamine pyrophosphorylase/glucosamine-1-phosphate N-acetyltransferase
MTGSGSVITEDVPDDAVAIGRARQVLKPGLSAKLFEKLKVIKASKRKETE